MKQNWIALAVTAGEAILLIALCFGLREYWLMLPVWMRSTAAACLALGFLTIIFRFRRRTL